MKPKKILKSEIFKNAEKNTQGFERISFFLENELGIDLECPKCKNKTNFQIFLNTELMSINTIIDHYNKVWRIETPNVGPLKIKDIKCLNCGNKDSEIKFKRKNNE